ncbi:hypothetical protein P9265_18935 [Schinkia azotoformans]|nr:hypothetical protein [Schinkia azotoformans]
MTIVGLPGAAAKESRERVLAALKGFHCDFSDHQSKRDASSYNLS